MENNTATRLSRAQTLRAMQTLAITMGGVKGYTEWLAAMPEGAALSPSGGVEQSTLMDVAADDVAYAKAKKTFAAIMKPVLESV